MNNEKEIGQATLMATVAKIELRPGQIDDYIFARNCNDDEFFCESDQVLLGLCIDYDQEIKLREAFNMKKR